MRCRFCFTLDLKDDPVLITEYQKYHEKIWPKVTQSLKESGVEDLDIYLLGTRMFMIMEVNESFSFEKKCKADQQNPKIQAWEQLYVEIPASAAGSEAWRKMAAHGTYF